MDPVSKTPGAPVLPAEFAHPALQQLIAAGQASGSIDSSQLKDALEASEIAPNRMKTVLRALDEHGIAVTLDSEHAARAVATTTTRRSTSQKAAAKKTAAKKPAADEDEAKPAKKAAAKKTTAKKAAADESGAEDEAQPAKKAAAKKTAATKAPATKAAVAEDTTEEKA